MTDERLELLEGAEFPFVFRPYTRASKPVTVAAVEPAVTNVEVPGKKPTSSLDLLCSITSQSFEQVRNWCDSDIDNDESPESWPPTPPAPPTTSGSASSSKLSGSASLKQKVQRARGPNCGECDACLRDDCGKCKACLDKPKFGGPNTMKRRCFNRYCFSRKQEDRPPQELKKGGSSGGGKSKSEEAIMKAELAKIKAELDAKAMGVKYGFKMEGVSGRRSSRTIENLLKELEESDDDEDEVMDSDGEEDEVMEDAEGCSPHKFAPSEELSDAVYKTALAADILNLPRGVTMRPSGKWVSSKFFYLFTFIKIFYS